jgi:ADP-ribosyl-[dinitrogen reductase] hydrolase
MSLTARERFVGCLVGGAIGDALGAGIEFDSISGIRRRHGARGVLGYTHAYGRLGAITDDTQMTLFTAEGLIRAEQRFRDRGICNVAAVVSRSYQRWLLTQDGVARSDPDFGDPHSGWLVDQPVLHSRRAPGNTCLSALQSDEHGSVDRPLNDSKGCGAVMRIAPVGLIARDPFKLGVEIAALTHGHPSGYLSAGAFAQVIHALTRGATMRVAVTQAREALLRWDKHEETLHALDGAVAAADGGVATPERIEALGGGWTGEEALAIAVFCVLSCDDVRAALLAAVNHSGDSDSTGAIAGNLLGAAHGFVALPADLLADLEARDLIEQVANDLVDTFVDGHTLDYGRYPTY